MSLLGQPDLKNRCQGIRLLALDVDGVLTDGTLSVGPNGEFLKQFHARDGQGLKILQGFGIDLAIISARQSEMVAYRAEELGITRLHQGVKQKRVVYEHLLQELGLDWYQGAYMGDDYPDLAILKRCGLALTVPGAPIAIQGVCHWVASVSGGHGAVREAVDLLVEARGWGQQLWAQWQD